MIAAGLAILAAAANALASVLQRRAARMAPPSKAFSLILMWRLARQPSWLCGIGALVAGFLFQAAALSFGGLSLVQPVLVTELPFTMVLLAWMSRVRLGLDSWLAVGVLTVGLAILLIAAGPSDARRLPAPADWVIGAAVTVGVVGCLVVLARIAAGVIRATLLGVAAGFGFAFAAALMKEAVRVLEHEPHALLVSWPAYAMVATGLFSLFLLQNALYSGTLVAVQPALNVSDPVASIAYGVGLFGEEIRLGGWAVLEVLGIGLILYGSIRLAQSPLIRGHAGVTPLRT